MKHDRAKIIAHLAAILAQLEREHSIAEQNAAAIALGRTDLVRRFVGAELKTSDFEQASRNLLSATSQLDMFCEQSV